MTIFNKTINLKLFRIGFLIYKSVEAKAIYLSTALYLSKYYLDIALKLKTGNFLWELSDILGLHIYNNRVELTLLWVIHAAVFVAFDEEDACIGLEVGTKPMCITLMMGNVR